MKFSYIRRYPPTVYIAFYSVLRCELRELEYCIYVFPSADFFSVFNESMASQTSIVGSPVIIHADFRICHYERSFKSETIFVFHP